MYYTGFADEAGKELETQIKATKELGWKHIETRVLGDKNLASIDEGEFESLCQTLADKQISFNCFGSGIANWAKPITKEPEDSYEEMRRAAPRMNKLGIDMVRIMSFPVPGEDHGNEEKYFPEVVKRLKMIVEIAADAGITCVHENCSGWAALSWEHTLRILEAVNSPYLKLVFDTGNPVFHADVRGQAPYKNQNAWEFYQNVKEHIVYVHIKDGKMVDGKMRFTHAGEGDGYVREIVADLLADGYDGGFSMEPHLAVVFHDPSVTSDAEARYRNYVEYGQRFERLVGEVRNSLNV